MPADFQNDILHRLLDDDTLAFWQRRVLDEGKLNERLLFSAWPVAEEVLRHLKYLFGLNVAGNHSVRIVRYVIARLNQPHHRRGGGCDCLSITQRLLAAGVLIEKPIGHLTIQIVIRIRLVTIYFTDHYLTLTLELFFVEERIARGVFHELHRGSQIRTGSGEEVIDDFLARRTVVSDAQLADGF